MKHKNPESKTDDTRIDDKKTTILKPSKKINKASNFFSQDTKDTIKKYGNYIKEEFHLDMLLEV